MVEGVEAPGSPSDKYRPLSSVISGHARGQLSNVCRVSRVFGEHDWRKPSRKLVYDKQVAENYTRPVTVGLIKVGPMEIPNKLSKMQIKETSSMELEQRERALARTLVIELLA